MVVTRKPALKTKRTSRAISSLSALTRLEMVATLNVRGSVLEREFYNKPLNQLSEHDPGNRFLSEVVSGTTGSRGINVAGISALYSRYLKEPCQYYTSKLEPLLGVGLYSSVMLDPKRPRDEFMQHLDLKFHSACYAVCEQVIHDSTDAQYRARTPNQ